MFVSNLPSRAGHSDTSAPVASACSELGCSAKGIHDGGHRSVLCGARVDRPTTPSSVGVQGRWDAYLVQPQEHPLDEHDNPLSFIAQLNFADLPNLLGYPESGLLQFFISTMPDVSDCTVLYHPTVAEDWARDPGDLPPWRPPTPRTSRYRSPWPVEEFTPLVDPAAELGVAGRIVSQRPAADAVFGGIRGHRIGGYPNFNQARSIPEGHVLLFQLDSDPPEPLSRWRILWGDLGTGRFTISPRRSAAVRLRQRPLRVGQRINSRYAASLPIATRDISTSNARSAHAGPRPLRRCSTSPANTTSASRATSPPHQSCNKTSSSRRRAVAIRQ